MRLIAVSFAFAVCACSGAPGATITLVSDAPPADAADAPDASSGPHPDAHDAQAAGDVAAIEDASADASDAAPVDSALPDTSVPDTSVACGGVDPPSPATFSTSCFATATDGFCPPCAPYGFYCNQNEIPTLVPLDGLRGFVVNGGRRWCAPKPYCVRLASHDTDCGIAQPLAYSCSSSMDGAVLGPHPNVNCSEFTGSGGVGRITCCAR